MSFVVGVVFLLSILVEPDFVIATSGDSSVGKTCMFFSGKTNSFPEVPQRVIPINYIPTVLDNYSANVMVDNRQINIGLWDTAGHEYYDKIRPLTYPSTDVFLICFSIDSKTSFDNIKSKWYPEIQHHAPGVPFILVGTKLDVRGEGKAGDFVTKQMGEQLREELKAYKYLECSARTQEGLKQFLENLARAVLDSSESIVLSRFACSFTS